MNSDIINLENYTFMANQHGKLTLILPSLTGKPSNPKAKINNGNELVFARNLDIVFNLKNLNEETLGILTKVKKFLVIEADPEIVADMILEGKEETNENMLAASTNVYEVSMA